MPEQRPDLTKWSARPRTVLGGLSAIVAGSGPRIVLLHGVGLQAEAWAVHVDDLAREFEVIAFDMAGHGESASLRGTPELAAYADLVAGAVDGPFYVVGHSMGAMLVLDLACRYPDLVRGVGALNAIYRRDAASKAAIAQRVSELDGGACPDPTGTLSRWFGDATSEERLACEAWLRDVDPAAYKDAYAVFAAEDAPADAALASLDMPVLFCTGAMDPNSTPAMSKAMARLVPQSRALIVQEAAHMMPMTHAHQVIDAIRSHVRTCAI